MASTHLRSLVVACALGAVTCRPSPPPSTARGPASSAPAPEPVASVSMPTSVEAATWPVPPEQKLPWSARGPSSPIPPAYVEAASKLFTQGMADPRGCAWHVIDVDVGSVWGGRETIATRGWLL